MPAASGIGEQRGAGVSAQRRIPLPKSRSLGALVEQWVRCGKPGCRCVRGQLHGPYFAVMARPDGRLRKRYVRLADAATVRSTLDTDRCERAERRHAAAVWRRAWRAAAQQVREQAHDA
jgi:hypothetical protein